MQIYLAGEEGATEEAKGEAEMCFSTLSDSLLGVLLWACLADLAGFYSWISARSWLFLATYLSFVHSSRLTVPHSCCLPKQSRQRSGAAVAGRDQGESAACSDISLAGKTQAGKLSDAFPAEIAMAPAVCLGVGHPVLSTWLSFLRRLLLLLLLPGRLLLTFLSLQRVEALREKSTRKSHLYLIFHFFIVHFSF